MDASMLMQMFVVMQGEELTRQGSLGLSSTIGNQQIVFTLTIAFGFNSEHECQGKTEHATQMRGEHKIQIQIQIQIKNQIKTQIQKVNKRLR